MMFTCLTCLERYWASHGDPALVGGVYGAYTR